VTYLTGHVSYARFGRRGLLSTIAILVALSATLVPGTAGGTASNGRPSSVTATARSDYEAAKAQWVGEGIVGGSAFQGIPLFLARDDLERALPLHASNAAALRAAAAELNTLLHMPDSGYTPALDAKWNANQTALTRFFGVGPIGEVPRGPGFRAAQSAWEKEPSFGSEGVTVSDLQQAIRNLERGPGHLDAGATSAYPAAIADLLDLESATKRELASDGIYEDTNVHGNNRLAFEILFLNAFFYDGSDIARYRWVLLGK